MARDPGRTHTVGEAMTIERASLRRLAPERFNLQEMSFHQGRRGRLRLGQDQSVLSARGGGHLGGGEGLRSTGRDIRPHGRGVVDRLAMNRQRGCSRVTSLWIMENSTMPST